MQSCIFLVSPKPNTHPSDCQTEKRVLLMFPLLQWQHALPHTPSNASHCTCWCETCMQLLGHGNPLYKLPPHSFCAYIDASFELFRGGIRRAPCTSALGDPTLWLNVIFDFMAELMLFLNASTFHLHHLQLTECIAGMKFHELTNSKGRIQSEYRACIHWALQNDPFFSQMHFRVTDQWNANGFLSSVH